MRHDVSSVIQKEFILPDPTGDIKEVLIAELATKCLFNMVDSASYSSF